jgi:teichoic acid transport system permease protein
MGDGNRLPGPGRLQAPPQGTALLTGGPAGSPEPVPADAPPGGPPAEPLAALAARYGLRPSAARPPLPRYLRTVWQRRHFVVAYATARTTSTYTDSRLGQVWQVLTPLLNAGVYYLIFGVIFQARRGIPNYPAFLVAGVFVFAFTERSVLVAATVMPKNLALIRAMYFPRACLPLACILAELQQLLVSMVVLAAIVLATGEPLTRYWLALPPALALQTTFNVGIGLIMARLGAQVGDIGQLVPFFTRTWRYFCGVMYSVAALPVAVPAWAKAALAGNPAAVFISLTRWSLLASQRAAAATARPLLSTGGLWLCGAGWAALALAIGVVCFWQAETRYGRG